MANPANTVSLQGRLVSEVKFNDHANGQTATGLLKVAVKDNFMSKGADGSSKYQTQFIDMQTFVKSDAQRKLFANFVKGEMVAVSAHLKSARFMRDGKEVFEQQLVIDDIVSLGKPASDSAGQAFFNANPETPAEAPAAPANAQPVQPVTQINEDPFAASAPADVNLSPDDLPF